MKNKKAVLIYPTPIGEVPMNLAHLGAVLRNRGYEVKAYVNNFKEFLQVEDFLDRIRLISPDFVGISITTFNLLMVYELISKIKEMGIPVVAGGPHPSACPEECLFRGVDIVVRNEGEITLGELCDYWENNSKVELKDILGISYMDEDGRIVHNPPRPYVNSLDELPFPALDIFDTQPFTQEDGLIRGFNRVYSYRGCPARCAFCSGKVFGTKLHGATVERLIKEIEYRYEKFGIRNFSVADSTFTTIKEKVYKFCEELKKSKLDISWKCTSRVNTIDIDMLKAMKDAGCFNIGFGFESGDPETLKRIQKGVTVEQNINAAEIASKAGLKVYGCLMTGFPWESEKHVQNTIDFVNKTKDYVFLYQVSGAIVPFPGTSIYEEFHKEYGFTEYWLDKKYQFAGIQIYQNVTNPYEHSVFYQRTLFDDTYIMEDYFFPYTGSYKRKVKELVYTIGKYNLRRYYKTPLNRWAVYQLARLSRRLYEITPDVEKKVVNKLMGKKKKAEIEVARDQIRSLKKEKEQVE